MAEEGSGLQGVKELAQTLFRNRVSQGAANLLTVAQSIQDEGMSDEDGSRVDEIISSTLKGVPNRGALIEVRKVFNEINSMVTDLSYAAANDLIEDSILHRDIEVVVAKSKHLVEICSGLPEDADAPVRRGGISADELSAADVTTATKEVDPAQVRRVEDYYRKAQKIPSTIKGNHGVDMMTKIPIIVVGIFGDPIQKIGQYVKINEFVDGYAVFESQIIVGIDDSFIAKEYGQRKVHDESFALSIVKDLIESYNKKKPNESLAFVSDNSQRRGRVRWWWIMRERVLSRILNRVHGFGGDNIEWAFPSRIQLSGKKDNNRLEPAKVEFVFKLWIRGAEIEEIAEQTGYKPALIKALISGNEAPEMTRDLRRVYQIALKQRRERLNDNFSTNEKVVLPHAPSVPPLADLPRIYNSKPGIRRKR